MTSIWDFFKRLLSGIDQTAGFSPQRRATPPDVPARNPFEAHEILGLSAEDLRRRAMRINPFFTRWIGRTDVIPPISDQRTALIDRGLMLRGLLTAEQLEEIHRIGDLWLARSRQFKHLDEVATAKGDAAVAALRAERAARKEQKRRESAERARQRVEAVALRTSEDIVFLGRGVSSRLADRTSNIDELGRRGLPLLSTPNDVARALGIPVSKLRWLCFHSEATERTHYVAFDIPKRSGGTRRIAAPMPELARVQRWILCNILNPLATEEQAHGFVRGRSTATNAAPHCRRDVVINLDLSDFFPTITFPRVRGVFEKLGYSPAVATVLALACTEAPRCPAELGQMTYWVATGPRALPQGASTSPAISNQVARKLDRRLSGMCARLGWTYTRYADDLTFSAPEGKRREIPLVRSRVRQIVEDEGFAINPKKGRVQRSAGRQMVTGVVVNETPHLPREEVRRLRAILHGARLTGLAAQNREGRPHFEAWLRGKLAYLAMIDRTKGTKLLAELDEIVAGEI